MKTIYIGGGTPTSLSAKQLDVLLKGVREQLTFDDRNEFTVEANPGDLTQEKLQVMKNYGVNRLSSIDLIYALPGQTLESFRDTLTRALALDLPHYSLYSLILENKTMFMNWVRQGRLQLPEEEIEAQMFDETIEAMEKKGRHQYEVSNFALTGKESQHNLAYWNNDHYYGFGAGASGYLGQTRYKNHGPIQHYLKPLRENQLPIVETEELTRLNQIEEELFLGLRKKVGISKQKFQQKFQEPIEAIYGEVIQRLIKEELLIEEADILRLTKKGLFVGNNVFEAFLLSEKE